jgi:hypothetical protein
MTTKQNYKPMPGQEDKVWGSPDFMDSVATQVSKK